MKNRYRKFRRGDIWWSRDGQTRNKPRLKTKSKAEAIRLLDSMNQPYQNAGYILEMARTHLKQGDASRVTCNWKSVFDDIIRAKAGSTKFRWERAAIRTNLRYACDEVEKWTERLANLREDLKLRQDTSGDKFRIELEKQILDNRGVAGELLIRRAEKIKLRFGEDIRIGTFAGYDLFIHKFLQNSIGTIIKVSARSSNLHDILPHEKPSR